MYCRGIVLALLLTLTAGCYRATYEPISSIQEHSEVHFAARTLQVEKVQRHRDAVKLYGALETPVAVRKGLLWIQDAHDRLVHLHIVFNERELQLEIINKSTSQLRIAWANVYWVDAAGTPFRLQLDAIEKHTDYLVSTIAPGTRLSRRLYPVKDSGMLDMQGVRMDQLLELIEPINSPQAITALEGAYPLAQQVQLQLPILVDDIVHPYYFSFRLGPYRAVSDRTPNAALVAYKQKLQQTLQQQQALGKNALAQARYPAALDAFQACLELEPENAHWWASRGLAYRGLKQCGPARADFAEACRRGAQEGCVLSCP